MNDVLVETNNRPFALAIPDKLFENQHSLTLSLHLRSNTPQLCWFRFSPPSIHFFPTDEVVQGQPVGGYQFALFATNTCGLSATVPFALTLKTDKLPSCVVFEVEVVHAENLCEESTLKEFFDRLQSSLNNNVRILNIGRTTQHKSSINFTVIDSSLDCSSCNLDILNDLARQFTLQNLVGIFSHSNVITSVTSSRLIVTSSCKNACSKGEDQKEISFNSRAGQINKFDLTNSLKDVSLLYKHNPNTCLIQSASGASIHLLFLPPKQIHPGYALQSHQVKLVEAGKACPFVLKIHSSQHKPPLCHRINIHFNPIRQFSCPLEAIRGMVTLLTDFFHVQTSQIFIHDFRRNGTNGDLDLVVSFTTDVIGCTHCAKNILKSFISRLVDSQGKVTTEFGKVLKNSFTIFDIDYRVTSQVNSLEHDIAVTENHVPIWVYMVPALIVLLILLLLLLACCFCCGGYTGSRRKFSKFVSNCCFCCYSNRDHHNRRKRSSSIHRVTSLSKDIESNLILVNAGNENKSGDVGNENKSGDVGNENKNGERNNSTTKTVSYAAVHKTHNLLSPSSSKSGDVKTQESTLDTSKGNTTTVEKTALRVKHRRSYSDGFLLDDDYLDLPSPPTARKTNDISRRTSHRSSFRYRCKNNVVDDSKEIGHKLTIPIRITARVKNISRSLENGLDRTTNYVTFDEAPDVSKYRSRETVYERTSPLDTTCSDNEVGRTSYRRKSHEKYRTSKRYPWESEVKTFRRKSTKKWFDSPRYSTNWKGYSESEFW